MRSSAVKSKKLTRNVEVDDAAFATLEGYQAKIYDQFG
jgi:hypothetical protein